MHELLTVFSGILGAAVAWPFVEFVARPFRQFFDIRRQVNRAMVLYGNVSGLSSVGADGVRRDVEIRPEEEKRLVEAHFALRGLAADMRAFANGEYFANKIVNWFGYDANKIASALIGYSHSLPTFGEDRQKAQGRVEKLLGIKSTE